MTIGSVQYSHKEILNLLLKGDRLECLKLVQRYVNNQIPIEIVYENILKKPCMMLVSCGKKIK